MHTADDHARPPAGHADDDLAAVGRLRAGDPTPLDALFRRHHRYLVAVAARSAPPWVDAHDVATEAFVRMYAAVRNGRGPRSSVRGYLVRTTRRLAAEAASRSGPEGPEPGEGAAAEPALAVEDRLVVRQAMAHLPHQARLLLWRTEVEGRSTAAAARSLGIPPAQAAVVAYRAREALRTSWLALHCPPPEGPGRHAGAGELAAWVRTRRPARVAAHVRACPSCRARAAHLQQVNRRLRPGAPRGRHGGSAGLPPPERRGADQPPERRGADQLLRARARTGRGRSGRPRPGCARRGEPALSWPAAAGCPRSPPGPA